MKYLEIVHTNTGLVHHRMDVSSKSERAIDKIEAGTQINLNHNEYHTIITELETALPIGDIKHVLKDSTNDKMRKSIIENGVKNLKEFGYPNANSENILTDTIYSAFFENMLEQNKSNSTQVDIVIDEILKEINSNKK